MFNEFLRTAKSLYSGRDPFAMVFVVNRQVPSSGKPGDKAVILPDGTIEGWIGGGCTRGIVLKEAIDAMNDGKPRLVKITPDGDMIDEPGVTKYPMTCHSGGMVEVYIEPVMPKPRLFILGKSHVAMALSKLANAMDYRVSVVARNADSTMFSDVDDIYESLDADLNIRQWNPVVVCTQGENDELSLLKAARSDASYVAFVSSRKKAHAIFQFLREQEVSTDRLKEIRTPAGLDINAKLPEEVAVSILAQIIEHLRTADAEDHGSGVPSVEANSNLYINPVCGVPIDKKTAKHVIEYEGEQVYFCCDGCKVMFDKEPAKYMAGA